MGNELKKKKRKNLRKKLKPLRVRLLTHQSVNYIKIRLDKVMVKKKKKIKNGDVYRELSTQMLQTVLGMAQQLAPGDDGARPHHCTTLLLTHTPSLTVEQILGFRHISVFHSAFTASCRGRDGKALLCLTSSSTTVTGLRLSVGPICVFSREGEKKQNKPNSGWAGGLPNQHVLC